MMFVVFELTNYDICQVARWLTLTSCRARLLKILAKFSVVINIQAPWLHTSSLAAL